MVAHEASPAFFRYFEGKIVAEDAVAETFGKRATILRPGFIFGVRKVCSFIPIIYCINLFVLLFDCSPVSAPCRCNVLEGKYTSTTTSHLILLYLQIE